MTRYAGGQSTVPLVMKIGELSRKTGIPPSKIRYYEKVGVLPAPKRTENGYRAYEGQAMARLELLQRGKVLGLTLDELSDLLRAAVPRSIPWSRGCWSRS